MAALHGRQVLPRHTVVSALILAAGKLKLVEKLQSEGRVAAMAGDTINDAPALARANISGHCRRLCGRLQGDRHGLHRLDDNISRIPRS